MRKPEILLVDDDLLVLKTLCEDLESRGFTVTTAESGQAAIDILNRWIFDLVITDLVMDSVDGIEVLKASKTINPEGMVILLTGHGDMASAVEAVRFDADDYVLKPCGSEELFVRIRRCLTHLEMSRKIKVYESILPVCCVCKKIRDDSHGEPGKGNWVGMEAYLHSKARIDVSSGYCPECAKKVEEELDRDL